MNPFEQEMIVSIIGIGLIGGSMAITLKENGFADHVIGVDANEQSLDKALRRRIIDEALPFAEGIEKADVVIVATPVDAMLEIIPKTLDLVEHQVVTDVGSTKEVILAAVKNHPKRQRFVAAHPMAA